MVLRQDQMITHGVVPLCLVILGLTVFEGWIEEIICLHLL